MKAIRRNAAGYQMFFLNTVAVAPNKFRPSSKMGDMRCDLRPCCLTISKSGTAAEHPSQGIMLRRWFASSA